MRTRRSVSRESRISFLQKPSPSSEGPPWWVARSAISIDLNYRSLACFTYACYMPGATLIACDARGGAPLEMPKIVR